jgi:MFS transporter, Spinster family, sphingosine-1-phosphate transporter
MRLPAYRSYLLTLLTVIFTFNFADRFALGMVVDNIKADLGLSDSQLGILSGIAFALFYSVMGIPIARWADRGNRRVIIALTAVLWSAMVALCGAAANFVQLLLIRVGVGVGEAGCTPPAHSLIADYYTRAERPRATAIYWQGANLSLIIAYFVAGWLNQFYGWRVMFVLIGLPGLIFGALAWFTIREPRQAKSTTQSVSRQPQGAPTEVRASLREVCTILWRNASFRHLLYAFSVFYFFGYGLMQWQPAFFERSFGLNSGELGTWLAIVYTVTGVVGQHCGGVWVSRYAATNERLQLRAMAIMNAGFNSIIWSLIYMSPNYYTAFAFMGLSTLGGNTIVGPMYAMTQTLVPPRMRATATALILLFANLIGMGLGPLAAGVVSDALRPLFGEESLRYALLSLTPGYLWMSWHLWQASKTVTTDLAGILSEAEAVGNEGVASVPVVH